MSELSRITNNAQRSSLELRVFTSAARVIAGDPNRTFSPTTSTLIFGARDAVLADALLIREDVDALGDMIASTGRTLTTIFIHARARGPLFRKRSSHWAISRCACRDHPRHRRLHQFAYRGWCAAVFVLLWRHRLEGDLAAVAALM